MKRFFKITLTLLLTLTLLFSFTSCIWIDELREKHAVHGQNGELILNGTVYKKLLNSGDFYVDYSVSAYLTKSGVPVLLAPGMSEYIYITHDDLFIARGDYWYGRDYYVKEEFYEKYQNLCKSYTLDRYCIFKKYFTDENGNVIYEQTPLILDEFTQNVFEMTIETVEPTEKKFSTSQLVDEIQIYQCDETGYFSKESFKIQTYGKTHYISRFDNSRLHPIDEKYNSVIEKLFEQLDYFEITYN